MLFLDDQYQHCSLDDSILLRLPLEIRQEIYGYVLGREENCLVALPFKIRAVPEGHSTSRENVRNAALNQCLITSDEPRFWPQRTALIRTCRQIYNEAIDLLYCGNIFVVKHPQIFLCFTKSIVPMRLNRIRNIRIIIEKPLCLVLTLNKVDSSVREVWESFWDAVSRIECLTSLCVGFKYCFPPSDQIAMDAPWMDALRPLLLLRGLLAFQLGFVAEQQQRPFASTVNLGEMPGSCQLKDLIRRIHFVARLPRGDLLKSIYSNEEW
ncbi:MAG: hypothetical protein Q9213_006694 [Squamulea squamosa]